MPLSHDLPVHRARHPDYSRNLGRVAAALHEARPGAPIIDIGANIGDSVAIIRDQVPEVPILCIEGDPQFLPYLHYNVRGLAEVEIAPVYVRHAAGQDDGKLAVLRGGGTASLVDQAGVVATDVITTRSLDDILGDHLRFANPGMLKLDTDGHDADILLQAESVLAAARPIVFFEFDPSMAASIGGTDPQSALDLLDRLGYRRSLFFTNTGALAGGLDVEAWASDAVSMAADLGPGHPVAYFDVCVFGPDDVELAAEIEGRERSIRNA